MIKQFNTILCLLTVVFLTNIYSSDTPLKGVIQYKAVNDKKSIYGTLNCKGSTNVEKLLKIWLPEFEKIYPSIDSKMDFKGSGQGIKALMTGEANIGAASRKIKKREYDNFKKLRGYPPLEIKVSLDALAIYVNRLNKIEKLTLPELDAIFSSTLKLGFKNKIENWKYLTEDNGKIAIYLYDKNSGTRSYFRKKVMNKGKFNSNNIVSDNFTKLDEVINNVANNPNGICFGSVGNKNYKVKSIALSKKRFYPVYKANKENIKNKKYPLTRYFYLYLDVPKDKEIPKFLYEFCKYILSKNGQKSVIEAGGLPLSPRQIGIELSKIRR